MTPDSLLHGEIDAMLHKAASELRQHLETGQDCRVETILSAFPNLASDPDRAVELIVLEFQLRRQLGHNPQPRDWYERFPQWSEKLRPRLEQAAASRDSARQETAAFATSPYDDADRRATEIVDTDVPVLGRHTILEEIDRGGMGVVYRAYDLVLDRVVALKVMRSGTLASADEVRRFYREARAAAQLRHPNIVPIYGMGLYERQHCFTMALFPRGSLSRHLAAYRQDIRGAVELVVKVARAVQAAHDQGIIHRDLKPSNILLDECGEPVVSDFGLAKRLEVSPILTLPAQAVGTPAYMAPEQARCDTATTASDIWSLGVILYELLTCRMPFPGKDVDEIKQKVLRDDPISPRRYCPDLPRDLVTIISKCLEKEPAKRYESAAALADDLERWLHNEPITARPEPRWQRLRRQFRRRVGVKGLLILLISLMMLGSGAAGVWTLFVYLSPAGKEQRRQGQVLASIQRDLAAGKSVTLVGELGPPKWYRWRTEKGRGPLPELKKSPFTLDSTQGHLLLELLPDLQLASYRYSAEVQYTNKLPWLSEAGLYFFCEELELPQGPEQCFGLFRLKFKDSQTTVAELRLIGLIEQDADELSWKHEIVPHVKSPAGPASLVLPPRDSDKRLQPWHRIEVHVTPEQVRTFCDGMLIAGYNIAEEQKHFPRQWRSAHGANFPLPAMSLRGGVGLYVRNGPIHFRNVVVEPLPVP